MNEALAMPVDFMAVNVGEMLAQANVQSEQRVRQLPVNGQLLGSIASVVNDLVSVTIERRTAAEFVTTRSQVFPHYFQALRALADLSRILVPRHVLEVLAAESFSEMEAEFRGQGLAAFGVEVRDQALFTVWTLRKTADICQRIDSIGLAPGLGAPDQALFASFAAHALGARFHLDCLLRSMLIQRPMPPEVLDVVIDGLRNAVNAYAWARRALDLRDPRRETDNVAVEWDAEDQQLLDEASYDMVPELL